jgi:hypothetical protein
MQTRLPLCGVSFSKAEYKSETNGFCLEATLVLKDGQLTTTRVFLEMIFICFDPRGEEKAEGGDACGDRHRKAEANFTLV